MAGAINDAPAAAVRVAVQVRGQARVQGQPRVQVQAAVQVRGQAQARVQVPARVQPQVPDRVQGPARGQVQVPAKGQVRHPTSAKRRRGERDTADRSWPAAVPTRIPIADSRAAPAPADALAEPQAGRSAAVARCRGNTRPPVALMPTLGIRGRSRDRAGAAARW